MTQLLEATGIRIERATVAVCEGGARLLALPWQLRQQGDAVPVALAAELASLLAHAVTTGLCLQAARIEIFEAREARGSWAGVSFGPGSSADAVMPASSR